MYKIMRHRKQANKRSNNVRLLPIDEILSMSRALRIRGWVVNVYVSSKSHGSLVAVVIRKRYSPRSLRQKSNLLALNERYAKLAETKP